MTIIETSIAKVLADSYVEYAVATSDRAIPDVVDGLKVSQRRIIQSAFKQSLWSGSPFKKVTRLEGAVLGELHPHGCLKAETLVPLLDGTTKTIKELYDLGLPQWIMSVENNKLVPKLATNFRVGKTVDKAIKFTINGKSVICTHNHKFLTLKGWKRADELTVNDSIVGANYDLNSKAYPFISSNSISNCVGFLHRVLYKNNKATKHLDLHHINHVKVDNRPSNVELLTKSEHSKRHQQEDNSGAMLGLKLGRQTMKTDLEFKELNSKKMKALNSLLPLKKAKQIARKAIEEFGELTEETYNKCRTSVYNGTKLKTLKININELEKIAYEPDTLPYFEKPRAVKQKKSPNSFIYASPNPWAVGLNKLLKNKICFSTFEELSLIKETTPRLVTDRFIKENCKDINNYFRHGNGSYFNKIEAVKEITLSKMEDFYDFTVEGPENMLIDIGNGQLICTHNSSGGTIINMCDASDFLNPLMQGHGNLGGWSIESRQKISGDAHAAPRYLECKLSEFSEAVFDIDIKYLKTKPNYDGSSKEVVRYVPALPLALVNGQSGIGTGFATNSIGFPVSNIIKAVSKVGSAEAVAKALGAPDVPYNTNIIKNEALVELHTEGRASLDLLGEWTIEKNYDTGNKRNRYREAVVITKLATGHAEQFIDKVKNAFENDKIEGIANVIDETSKHIRVIIVCKNKVKAKDIIPNLVKYTTLSAKYSAKFTMVDGNLPKDFTPSQILQTWYDARVRVLLNKYTDELSIAKQRLVVVEGLLKVFPNLKDIAILIMESDTPADAKASIVQMYSVTDETADAILNIQLKKLTKLSHNELELEQTNLNSTITTLQDLIDNPVSLNKEIVRLAKAVAKYACGRVSQVIDEPTIKAPKKTKAAKAAESDTALEKAIKASIVKCPNGKMSPPLGKRAFNNAVKKGIPIMDRVDEHVKYWKKKYSK